MLLRTSGRRPQLGGITGPLIGASISESIPMRGLRLDIRSTRTGGFGVGLRLELATVEAVGLVEIHPEPPQLALHRKVLRPDLHQLRGRAASPHPRPWPPAGQQRRAAPAARP